jgi:hypothetical protein
MLTDRKRVGVIIRSFAAKPELVKGQVTAVVEAVEQVLAVEVGGKKAITRVDVVVPMDQRFGDCDCGETAAALRTALAPHRGKVVVTEISHGDIFCTALNHAIGLQMEDRISYSIILSTQVRSYFNAPTLEKMFEAAENGARVTGVALDELTDSIREGLIANTFAMWHLPSLAGVGLFDFRAAKPLKEGNWRTPEFVGWIKPTTPEVKAGENRYHLAGVEEIIPLVRLGFLFGPCIAPILPQGEGVKQWIAPDPSVDLEGFHRHANKMATKRERQAKMAAMENADLSYISGKVLPEYRS